jgi:hypothetical protein
MEKISKATSDGTIDCPGFKASRINPQRGEKEERILRELQEIKTDRLRVNISLAISILALITSIAVILLRYIQQG